MFLAPVWGCVIVCFMRVWRLSVEYSLSFGCVFAFEELYFCDVDLRVPAVNSVLCLYPVLSSWRNDRRNLFCFPFVAPDFSWLCLFCSDVPDPMAGWTEPVGWTAGCDGVDLPAWSEGGTGDALVYCYVSLLYRWGCFATTVPFILGKESCASPSSCEEALTSAARQPALALAIVWSEFSCSSCEESLRREGCARHSRLSHSSGSLRCIRVFFRIYGFVRSRVSVFVFSNCLVEPRPPSLISLAPSRLFLFPIGVLTPRSAT